MTREAGDCCERIVPRLTVEPGGLLECSSCGTTLEAVWQGDDGSLHSSEAGAGVFELVP